MKKNILILFLIFSIIFIIIINKGSVIRLLHTIYKIQVNNRAFYDAEAVRTQKKMNELSTELDNILARDNSSYNTQEIMIKRGSVPNGVHTDTTNTISGLSVRDSDYEYIGMPIAMNVLIESIDEIDRQYELSPVNFPFRDRLNKIKFLVNSHGYNIKDLYTSYSRLFELDRKHDNMPKTTHIISLSENQESKNFIRKIDKIFHDKNNIAYMLILLDYHYSQGAIENIFDETEILVSVVDKSSLSIDIKNAILHYALRTVSFFGYSTDDRIEFLRQSTNAKVGIGCVHLLNMLEKESVF